MRARSILIFISVLLCAACAQPHPDEHAQQRQLFVMSSGGFTAAYKVLAPKFESETGVKLVTAYGASSGGAPASHRCQVRTWAPSLAVGSWGTEPSAAPSERGDCKGSPARSAEVKKSFASGAKCSVTSPRSEPPAASR